MGCDGGSIPRREEMVKTKKAAEKPEANSQNEAKWTLCSLSKRPLALPVVACYLGKLYNKDTILEFLLDKESFGDADVVCPHISSLKDVVNLNLQPNPQIQEKNNAAIQGSFQESKRVSPFICPVTQKEMNGHSKFVFLEKCGCVMSENALKTVNSDHCLVCNRKFAPEQVILINPSTPDEVKLAQERVNLRPKKKSKKRKQEPELLGSSDEEKHKKTKASINMVLPDLTKAQMAAKNVSDTVSKLYAKGPPVKENFLTMGTFNRYAAQF